MADKPVAKVGLAFEVPLTSVGAESIRQGAEELRNRLLAYAEVLQRERNVICQDIYVSQPGSALFDLKPADASETRLKGVVDKGNGHKPATPVLSDEPAEKPKAKKAKAKEVEPAPPAEDDPEDPPRVVAVPIEKKPAVAAAVAAGLTTEQWLEKALPHTGKRTPKTLALLTALIDANKEVSPVELAKAAAGDYSNLDVSSWLGQCLKKKNPYVVRGERGNYKFVKEDLG